MTTALEASMQQQHAKETVELRRWQNHWVAGQTVKPCWLYHNYIVIYYLDLYGGIQSHGDIPIAEWEM